MTQQNICDSVDTMNALLQAMRSPFQSCPLFSCRCDKSKNEWKKGCYCLCHFDYMNKKYGNNDDVPQGQPLKWDLGNFGKEASSNERD